MSDSFNPDFPEEPASGLDGHSSGGSAIDLPDEGATQAIPTVSVEPPVESVLTASVQGNLLEFQLTSPQRATTDILAAGDLHAFLLKDPEVGAALDQFAQATVELWEDAVALRAPALSTGPHEGTAAQLDRLRLKWPESHVLLTPKTSLQPHVDAQFNELLKRLVAALPLPESERKLTVVAGQIHSLVRFKQSDPGAAGSKTSISSYAGLLSALHEEPALVAVLRSMYVGVRTPARNLPTASGLGAQALTLVDLFCDRFHPEHALHRALVTGLQDGMIRLAGTVLSPPVMSAFLALLAEDLPTQEADDHKNRVLVYTDWLDHIVPLEARLRQEGFQAFITDSLEACPQINRRKQPNIIILRLRAQPSIVIKAIHYLLSNGVTLTETPTFLLVDGQHIDRLTSLLALGIEDILDLLGRLDQVILKLKKVRSRLVGSSRAQLAQAGAGAGTSGNLSDMNLIDLLQALGPSQRTARVTLHAPEPSTDVLSLYLNKGCISFAELGALKGDAAVHQAMTWHQGNWLVEHVTDAELPASNTSLSNEAILIEGCRLLDERARGAESAPA